MDKNGIKISFIVPCYNVERYVEQCIHSIEAQTVGEIEIIPVDDGSPDSTGMILDHLAAQDARIRVIHKKNGGVSAARNSALDIALGEYIVFVDGDDYIAPDYASYMLMMAEKDDADFVLTKNWFTREGQLQVEHDMIETITPLQTTALLLSLKGIVGSHNKMYRRSFIEKNKLRFSTSLFYGEGLNFIIKTAQLANRVTTGERMVYYYRRNNEVSATTKYDVQKYRNGETALDKIAEELLMKDADVCLMMALHKSVFCLGAISQTYAHDKQNEYAEDCRHWRKVIKSYLPILLRSSKVSLYRKLLLLGGLTLPSVVSKLDMWRRKRVANHSVR
mgnify:CR=1 FL=1